MELPTFDTEETTTQDVADPNELKSETKPNLNFFQRLRNNPNTALCIVSFALYVDYLLLLACVPILPIYGSTLGLSSFGNTS